MATRQQPEWFETDYETDDADWNDPQQRLQNQVEIQSRQIDQVLARHDVPAGVRGGSLRPHWVSFDIASQLSEGWDKLRRITGDLTGEIASALGVPEVRLERQNGVLRLAVRRNEPHPVDLLDLLDLVPEAGDLSLALGLNHQGQPVMLNLKQTDLHNILIAGISGAGKSSLMRSIAVALALTCRQSRAQLAVIGLGSAPSGITTRPNPLYPVNYLPHLLFPVATEVDEAVEALAYLVEEINYRAGNNITSPALIIMVDDVDMLLRRVGGAVAEQVAALLHAPAEAGVRVIVGASNPTLPDLWQMLQHNVDLRLVGRMADERSAQMATGLEQSYAQYLDGKGDFIAVSSAGIEPFQAAYIDDYDLHLTLSELHRASGQVLVAQALDDEPSVPPSWSTNGNQGFTYDGARAEVSPEAGDRSAMRTIEIAVDPRPPEQQSGKRLSWLDDLNARGLGLPPAEEQDDDDDNYEADEDVPWHTAADEFAEDDPQSSEPDDAGLPAAGPRYGRPKSEPLAGPEQPDHPEPPLAQEPGTDQSDPDEPSAEAGYEMLPFDDGQAVEQSQDTAVTGGRQKDEPQEQAGDDQPAAASQPHAASHGKNRTAVPSKERAQTLWSVEPIYTDIDDDLWDAAADADDDDWRKRLH